MIWFDIKELEKRLVDGRVSDYLAFKYLLIQFILFNLVTYIPESNNNPIWSQGIHLIILLTALIWGFTKTFEINKAGDDRDYFKRFLSLSFVAGIRTIVFTLIFSFFLAIAQLVGDQLNFTYINNPQIEEGLELVFFLIFNIVYYYILITSFKRVNAAEGNLRRVEPA